MGALTDICTARDDWDFRKARFDKSFHFTLYLNPIGCPWDWNTNEFNPLSANGSIDKTWGESESTIKTTQLGWGLGNVSRVL